MAARWHFKHKRADVFEVAFTPAFHDGNDVVGIPESFSGTGAQAPIEERFQPRRTAQTFQLPFCLQAIDTATGADATIALQNLFAKIARIAS